MSSFFSVTPSIQRDTVIPGFSIDACDEKRLRIQSYGTPHTVAKCFHAPVATP
jgi:hypothetical protein